MYFVPKRCCTAPANRSTAGSHLSTGIVMYRKLTAVEYSNQVGRKIPCQLTAPTKAETIPTEIQADARIFEPPDISASISRGAKRNFFCRFKVLWDMTKNPLLNIQFPCWVLEECIHAQTTWRILSNVS